MRRADDVACAAHGEVFLGDAKAILSFAQDLQATAAAFGERLLKHQQASRGRRTAPDPPAQLVQLCKAKALGPLDHHDRRIGHIDANLDHCGRNQNTGFALCEGGHGGILLGRRELAMHEPNHPFPQSRAQALKPLFGGGHVRGL